MKNTLLLLNRYALQCFPLYALLISTAIFAEAVKVEVVKTADGMELHRGGERYEVRGAGANVIDYSTMAEHGINSVRTWGVEHIQNRLDAAQRNGLTISVNLPIAPERWGVDYNNASQMAWQRDQVRRIVTRYRDHPAVLSWIIGNELNFEIKNWRVYEEVNELSKMIHAIDPNHPTTTAVTAAEDETYVKIRERITDLDFISLQVYGAIAVLSQYTNGPLHDMPFMVTEWGPLGHWEVFQTTWGAPVEQTSTERAKRLNDDYKRHIQRPLQNGNCLGSYVFLWGQKQERTPTWYSMFSGTGESTESVDVMRFLWTGSWSLNRAPSIQHIRLRRQRPFDNIRLEAGQEYPARVSVKDPDGDDLTYFWSVKQESSSQSVGGEHENTELDIMGLISDPEAPSITVRAPKVPGAYRLYVNVYDGNGHFAHANTPFLVRSGD